MGWVLLMSVLMTAPPGYERLDGGLPGWTEQLPTTEFPHSPIAIRLDTDEMSRVRASLGEPTYHPATEGNESRTGYVFGRSDRPTVGFAIWIGRDGTGHTRGWVVEPMLPPMREMKQRWLVPGIVSWLKDVAH